MGACAPSPLGPDTASLRHHQEHLRLSSLMSRLSPMTGPCFHAGQVAPPHLFPMELLFLRALGSFSSHPAPLLPFGKSLLCPRCRLVLRALCPPQSPWDPQRNQLPEILPSARGLTWPAVISGSFLKNGENI